MHLLNHSGILKSIFLSKIKEYAPPPKVDRKWKKIMVPAGKGNFIATRWWKQIKKTSGCLILVHPYHKDAKDFFLESGHAELYYTLGFDVIILDLNGFGESSEMGFDFDGDIITVAKYYSILLDTDIILGHGISFGAAMLLKCLTRDHPFQGAVIENCIDETVSYYRKRSLLLFSFMQIIYFLNPEWKKSNQYYRAIKKVRGIKKLFLIYSEDDDLTTPSMGNRLLKEAIPGTEYYLLKGGHMMSIDSDREKYQATISKFTETLRSKA